MARRRGNETERRARVPGWLRFGLPLLVFVAAFLPFAPALSYGFVEYDDDRNFSPWFAGDAKHHNPWFNAQAHDLSSERLEWMFSASHFGHYQPLTWVSLALDAAVAGRFDPRDFHRTNLLLHALAAVLFYWLALWVLRFALGVASAPEEDPGSDRRLRLGALAAALLYGLHPLRVESVAWITERRDVLSSVFLLLSVLAYVRYVRGRSAGGGQAGWMLIALGCYCLSLLSKAWGITLPAVLLVLDLYPLRRRSGEEPEPWGRLIGEKLWYVPLALLSAWLAARAQGATWAVMTLEEHTLLERIAQASFGLGFYLVKTVWPFELSPLYLLEVDFDPSRPVYLVSMAAVTALTVALVLARKRFPAGLAAWTAYAIIVSPVLGFLQSGSQKVADRYTYLAAMPLCLLLGGLVMWLAGAGAHERHRLRQRLVSAAVVALAAGLGWLSWRQTQVWRDSESVYRRIVEIQPWNYFGQHCLAVVVQQQGRLEEAIEHERASIAAHPGAGNADARSNLARLLRMTGRGEEAQEALLAAHEVLLAELERTPGLLAPLSPSLLAVLSELLAESLAKGDGPAAVALLERSLARVPRFLEGYAELGRVQASLGRMDRAEQAWRRALELDPGWPPAHQALGRRAMNRGEAALAEQHFVRSLARGLFDVEALVDLGLACQAQGKSAQAASLYGQALSFQPQHARARSLLRALQAAPAGPPR